MVKSLIGQLKLQYNMQDRRHNSFKVNKHEMVLQCSLLSELVLMSLVPTDQVASFIAFLPVCDGHPRRSS